VLQHDEGIGPEVVPVRLTHKVRVEQLPTRMGAMMTVNVSETVPERLLPANPKRSSITFGATGGDYWIGRSSEAVKRDESRFLCSAGLQAGMLRFHWTDELWALKRAVGAATDRLSIATEDWVL
jgi:hypothetical protein